MDFGPAIKSVFSKYATFSGRASRSEYWYFVLFSILAFLVAGVIDGVVLAKDLSPFSIILNLVLLLPSLAVSVRRLHDKGRTGWWLLLVVVPFVGFIVLLIWFCTAGPNEANEYGAPPLALA